MYGKKKTYHNLNQAMCVGLIKLRSIYRQTLALISPFKPDTDTWTCVIKKRYFTGASPAFCCTSHMRGASVPSSPLHPKLLHSVEKRTSRRDTRAKIGLARGEYCLRKHQERHRQAETGDTHRRCRSIVHTYTTEVGKPDHEGLASSRGAYFIELRCRCISLYPQYHIAHKPTEVPSGKGMI